MVFRMVFFTAFVACFLKSGLATECAGKNQGTCSDIAGCAWTNGACAEAPSSSGDDDSSSNDQKYGEWLVFTINSFSEQLKHEKEARIKDVARLEAEIEDLEDLQKKDIEDLEEEIEDLEDTVDEVEDDVMAMKLANASQVGGTSSTDPALKEDLEELQLTVEKLNKSVTDDAEALASHNHDDRYFTKAEIDEKLELLAPASSSESGESSELSDYYTKEEADKKFVHVWDPPTAFHGSSLWAQVPKSSQTWLTSELDKNGWFGLAGRDPILCYKGTVGSAVATGFHNACRGKGRSTLTIIKAHDGSIFGGFTSIPWGTSNSWFADPNAWLFSLRFVTTPTGFKLPIRSNKISNAIYSHTSYGPRFGSGYDLNVTNNCFTATNGSGGSANVGHTYNAPATSEQQAAMRKHSSYWHFTKTSTHDTNYFTCKALEVWYLP